MKKTTFAILALSVLFLIPSCQKSDSDRAMADDLTLDSLRLGLKADGYLIGVYDTEEQEPNTTLYEGLATVSEIIPETEYAISLMAQTDILFSGLNLDFAKEQKVLPVFAEWGIKKVRFTYHSIDHLGNPCELSAIATYPYSRNLCYTHDISSVSINASAYIPNNDLVATKAMNNVDLRVFHNALCVSCDYEGCGKTEGMTKTVFLGDKLARQQLDATLAALEIVSKDPSVRMAPDYWSCSIGISRGGMVALALAKYLDTSAPMAVADRINLAGTYSVAGPLIPLDIFRGMAVSDVPLGPFSFIPVAFLKTYYDSYPEQFSGYRLEDLLSKELVDYRHVKDGVEKSFIEMASDGSTSMEEFLNLEDFTLSPRQMLSPSFYDSKGQLDLNSTLYRKLCVCMYTQDLSKGWVPLHDIRLFYCTNDDFIPSSVFTTTYSELAKAIKDCASPAKIRTSSVTMPDVIDFSNHMVTSLIGTVASITSEKPWE